MASVAPHDRFFVFVSEDAAEWPLPSNGCFTRIVCETRTSPQFKRYFYEQTRLPQRARALQLDVLHSLAYVGPVWSPCPSVLTVPDVMQRSPAHSFTLVRRMALTLVGGAAVRRSDAIIAISNFTRDEIVREVPNSREKVHVVHLAPKHSKPAGTVQLPEAAEGGPYLVSFSSPAANKNTPRLVKAYARARASGLVRHRLLLLGHPPEAGANTAEGVHWLGYLPDQQADAVLRHADGLIFPSLYEGFGLPILEAMRAGVAVASSRAASLPEVGGDAALYFDPEDVDDIANAIQRVSTDAGLRAGLVERGRQRAGQFSWERTAEETLAVYHCAIERHRRGSGQNRA
jgi:glycosyltransferase involved in cell wall biosynthesis